ncbi:hypothetical protein NC651_009029 [Populus alba x Populus x berolinensis]|nr:hypothetical protein NC651_009029 [Populus alba x Populus x berolinensis]
MGSVLKEKLKVFVAVTGGLMGLLTMEDAYYEEEMGVNCWPSCYPLEQHQWDFLRIASDGRLEILLPLLETIASNPLWESQGLVQNFDHTQKILDVRGNFWVKHKRLFGKMENINGLTSNSDSPSSLNCRKVMI